MFVTEDQKDESLESQAMAQLRRSPYPALRQVSCELRDGVLTLTGRVPNYFQKQMAQSVLMHCLEGLAVIDNQLDVGYSD